MLVDSTCQTPLWQEKNHAILPSLITNQNLMSMFGQAKDLYKLQKQAKQIKKNIKTLQIEAEVGGVTVTVSAEQEILDVKIADELMASDKKEELANKHKDVKKIKRYDLAIQKENENKKHFKLAEEVLLLGLHKQWTILYFLY